MDWNKNYKIARYLENFTSLEMTIGLKLFTKTEFFKIEIFLPTKSIREKNAGVTVIYL